MAPPAARILPRPADRLFYPPFAQFRQQQSPSWEWVFAGVDEHDSVYSTSQQLPGVRKYYSHKRTPRNWFEFLHDVLFGRVHPQRIDAFHFIILDTTTVAVNHRLLEAAVYPMLGYGNWPGLTDGSYTPATKVCTPYDPSQVGMVGIFSDCRTTLAWFTEVSIRPPAMAVVCSSCLATHGADQRTHRRCKAIPGLPCGNCIRTGQEYTCDTFKSYCDADALKRLQLFRCSGVPVSRSRSTTSTAFGGPDQRRPLESSNGSSRRVQSRTQNAVSRPPGATKAAPLRATASPELPTPSPYSPLRSTRSRDKDNIPNRPYRAHAQATSGPQDGTHNSWPSISTSTPPAQPSNAIFLGNGINTLSYQQLFLPQLSYSETESPYIYTAGMTSDTLAECGLGPIPTTNPNRDPQVPPTAGIPPPGPPVTMDISSAESTSNFASRSAKPQAAQLPSHPPADNHESRNIGGGGGQGGTSRSHGALQRTASAERTSSQGKPTRKRALQDHHATAKRQRQGTSKRIRV